MRRPGGTTGPSPSAATARPLDPERGARIKAIRTERGWTQRQFADNLGAHVRSVQYWEAGRGPIDYPYLQALADIGQTTTEWIEEGTTSENGLESYEIVQEIRTMGEKVAALEHQVARLIAAIETKEGQGA